jgi:DNA polymerase-1
MKINVLTSTAQLPDLSSEDELGIDVETTSFNDEEPAFHPFNGHRVAGYGLMAKSREAWYLPIRHRSPDAKNLDYEQTMRWLKDLASRPRTWVGHNIKFDCRFAYQDGIYLLGDLLDTMVLARMVDSLRFQASLAALSKDYCDISARKDSDAVNAYCEAAKTKDYGKVPIDILGTYCCHDLNATMELKEKLLQRLPPECMQLFEIERKATRTLLDSELHGVNVPRKQLLQFATKTLEEFLTKQDQLDELAGEHLDTGSNKEMTRILRDKLSMQPKEWTKTGNPSWDAETLRSYGLPVGDLAADVKELSYSYASFGEGWLKRLAPDDTLHPNFKQYGTKTGRLACEDPNFQNLDMRAKAQVYPRSGHRLISIDASQIEFRLFAHYTNSPGIIKRYNEDPNTDYHQSMADMLGIPRKPAKTLNFGFIYGMGRMKLEGALVSFIRQAIRESDEKILTALRRFNFDQDVTERNASVVASGVYNYMHRVLPEIRQFARRVEETIRAKGFVRNVYRRYYYLPMELAHKARNYVIQGAAADVLKDWLASIPPVLKEFNARLLANVHDELLLEIPSDGVADFIRAVRPVLESPHVELRVPIRVEVSACDEGQPWSTKKKYEEAV